MADYLLPESLYRLVCRSALPRDTLDVMELTKTIWEGEDYVPFVWADWLADPEGWLAVAEFGGKVIGLGKLTRLSPEDWWLEGLRVDPFHEGRRIASHLHDYLLDRWLRNGNGKLRLATASFRLPVQHLCDRTGFTKVGEFTIFAASALQGEEAYYQPVRDSEAQQALDFILLSHSLRLSSGLLDLGWVWMPPSLQIIQEAIERNQAYWWRDRLGLLVYRNDEEHGQVFAQVQLLACPLELTGKCLLDFRNFCGKSGVSRVSWTAPLHPDLLPYLESAGFSRDWDASIYIYEKSHP